MSLSHRERARRRRLVALALAEGRERGICGATNGEDFNTRQSALAESESTWRWGRKQITAEVGLIEAGVNPDALLIPTYERYA